MAQAQIVSDQEAFQAAGRAIARHGYKAFTLTDIAEELSLPPATIIVRFKTTKDFKKHITTYTIDTLRAEMAGVPVNRSGDGLLQLVASIAEHTPSRAGVTALTLLSQGNLQDQDLADLERTRGDVLREAVAARMPSTALAHDVAVKTFMAHIAGSISQWHAGHGDSPTAFLLARTQEWLTLANIPFPAARAPAQSQTAALDQTSDVRP